MKLETPDPIKQLEHTINWHKEQIELIEKAITILRGDSKEEEKKIETNHELRPELSAKESSKKIQWAKLIDKIFEKHYHLNTVEVMEKLIENGLDETIVHKNRNTIYSTLNRKSKPGKNLRRDEDKRYYRARKRRTAPIINQENEGEVKAN